MIDPSQVQLLIQDQIDVEQARSQGRSLATSLGFDRDDVEKVGLAVAELASNLLRYAEHGEIGLSALESPDSVGVQVHSRDIGPGIDDVAEALRDGFSSAGSLGSGLPGVQRLMDEFELTSGPSGTSVVCRKWRRLT